MTTNMKSLNHKTKYSLSIKFHKDKWLYKLIHENAIFEKKHSLMHEDLILKNLEAT